MSVNRTWLYYSPLLQKPYCQPCWLFEDRGNPNLQWRWIDEVDGSSRHLSEQIKHHEKTALHISAMAVNHR